MTFETRGDDSPRTDNSNTRVVGGKGNTPRRPSHKKIDCAQTVKRIRRKEGSGNVPDWQRCHS